MNFESQNKNLETFIKAAKLGFLEDVRGFSDISDLINKSSKNGWNALHYAIFHRHHEVALFLINKFFFIHKNNFIIPITKRS